MFLTWRPGAARRRGRAGACGRWERGAKGRDHAETHALFTRLPYQIRLILDATIEKNEFNSKSEDIVTRVYNKDIFVAS